MWAAFKRVIKPRGAIVLTASQPFTSALVMSNPSMFKYAWVWEKSDVTDIFNKSYRPLKRHEDVLVFSSAAAANGAALTMMFYPQGLKPYGKRCVNKNNGGDVFGQRASRPNGATYVQEWTGYPDSILRFASSNHKFHTAQKPISLFEYLIRTYTQPGELVFDPTCGSGTTAVAARQVNRRFICGDTSLEYVEVARKRLAQPYTVNMFEGAA